MIRDYLSHTIAIAERWLSDRGAGRRSRAPSERDARCLHQESSDLHRADHDANPQRFGGRAASNGVAIYGMMVGTLQIARAVNDRKFSDEILESGVSAALALAGEETAAPA